MLRLWDYEVSYLLRCDYLEQGLKTHKEFLKRFRYSPDRVLFWVDKQGFNTIVKEWGNV